MQVQVTVVGMQEFRAQLNQLETALAKEARVTALKAGAEIVRAAAASRAPRSLRPTKVGHLADHIIVEMTVNKQSETEVSVGPDTKHWYGIFVERGTNNIRARPFLRPALDENLQSVQDVIRETLRAEIRRLTGSV